MKCAVENECRICERLFCCAKCRSQHEKKKHPVDINNLELIENECYICNEKPLLFHPNRISEDLLAHIVKKHFPLYCKKCSKMYWSEEDLFANWKCAMQNLPCKLESGVSVIINSPLSVGQITSSKDLNNGYSMAVSTQTTPGLLQLDINKDEPVITPIISSISIQTKPQIASANGSLMEHSSVKNSSSFNTPAQLPSNGTSNRGKLVRTTSTPMELLINRPKEQHFDSSSHVSSIHTSGESDLMANSASLSSGKIPAKLQRTRGRGKVPVSATPLRQVMSKSIQRAIAEHGTINLRHKGFQPKKIFDSLSGSFTPPLDLRTSPALRRTQSEIVDRSSLYEEFHTSRTSSRKHIITSTKQIITEDVIISSNSTYEKLETVYETCHSVATPLLQSKNVKLLKISPSKVEQLDHGSPKAKKETKNQSAVCSSPQNSPGSESNNDEIFYTPKSSITSPNLDINLENENSFCASLKPTQSCPGQSSHENKIDQENTKPVRGKFWSLVSSVMRLASFGNSNDSSPEESNGLIKRCASFAGVISKTLSREDKPSVQQAKRKRTNTFDAHSAVLFDSVHDGKMLEGPTKKIKRIQGRRPIERMRNMT